MFWSFLRSDKLRILFTPVRGELPMHEHSTGPPSSASTTSLPQTSEDASNTNFILTLHPGTNYRLCVYGLLPAAVVFWLLWLIGPMDLVTRLGGAAFASLVLVGSVIIVLYFKADRTLIVDAHGVRLMRSKKTMRYFVWEEVARVRYGIVTLGRGARTAQVPLLWIHGKQGYRGLSILENYYNVPPGSVWNASMFAAELAGARGIPVVRKDGLIRDFGP